MSKFKTWLLENNGPKIVQNIENKYLSLFKTIKLQASAILKVRELIIANIVCEKQKQLDKKVIN